MATCSYNVAVTDTAVRVDPGGGDSDNAGGDSRLRVAFAPAQARALRDLADKAPPSARRTR